MIIQSHWWGHLGTVGDSALCTLQTLETGKFFHLLDSAPSATARHALLQTVAFVLHKGGDGAVFWVLEEVAASPQAADDVKMMDKSPNF